MNGVRPAVVLISALTAERTREDPASRFEAPLGILSLEAVLNARGIPTEILDLNLQWARSGNSARRLFESSIEAVRTLQPRILGLGTICSTYPLTIRLAGMLKQEFPETPIVIGGAQASLVDVATLKAFPFVDFILRGEGEETFPDLVTSVLQGRSPDGQPGLTFRIGGGVRRNPDAVPIQDLDSLPLPSFEAYTVVSKRDSLPLELGRGCPFSCRFCSTSGFFGRRYRLKSTRQVIHQMAFLHERHGVQKFDLFHDNFTVDRRRVLEFCRGLTSRRGRFEWSCSARTDCVDGDLLAIMRDAGCSGIFFGVETGSPRLQRFIGKGLNLDRAHAVLAECDRLGIGTTASLIIGYPDETVADLDATLRFFRDAVRLDQADSQLHILSPLAGTSLEREYRSRLEFDGASSDIPEFGVGQGRVEKRLVERHPDVFPNFYAFPNRVGQPALSRMSEFFVNLHHRCNGLLVALTDASARPLHLFERWTRESGQGRRPAAYYRRRAFVDEFLAFVRAAYVGRGDTAIDVMWRFYGALRAAGSGSDRESIVPKTGQRGRRGKAFVRLAPGVRIVAVRGDVVKVLECLKKGRKPGVECLHRDVTVCVRKGRNGRSIIAELPSLTAAILRCADGSVDEIVRRLTRKGLKWENRVARDFVPGALRILEREGLVQTTASG